MLKIIEFIFILLSGISLIIIASLFTGIEIDDLKYNNINIKKLYLKYDKNLNISIQKVIIQNSNSLKNVEIKASFNIAYHDGLFLIDMKDFLIKDTDLKFTGLIEIDPNKINLDTSSDLTVKNLVLTFDKALKNVNADTLFVKYQNNKIDLSFKKPSYEDVLLDRSKVSYSIEDNVLKLYLKTQSLFNNTIKNILSHYAVNIDTIQYDGTNDISTNIFIPFGKGNIKVDANVIVLNSNLEDFGYKYKVNKSILSYKDNIINGEMDLDSIKYNDMEIFNSHLTYDINIESDLKVNVKSKQLYFTKDNYNFYSNNSTLYFKNDKINFSSKIHDEKNEILINLNNTTDTNTKKTSGLFNLKYYDNHNISIEGENIKYKGDFQDDLNITIQAENIKVIKPYTSVVKNLSLNILNNVITSKLLLNNEKDTHRINIQSTSNLSEKISYGNIGIEKFSYNKLIDIENKNVPYKAFFQDNIVFNSPIFGLTYFKSSETKKNKLIISNPKKLLDSLNILSIDKNSNGFIEAESDDYLENITVHLDNLNLEINSSYFDSLNDEATENIVLPRFPSINLLYTDSNIKYNDYTLSFDRLNMIADNNTSNTYIIKDKSRIKLSTEGNRISFNASNLDDNYVNSFLNKEIFEDGYLNINIYGDDINELSGDIDIYDTTIKNVTLINSLTTFVNTTPAIINPLLALPTLFRLAQTGFDTNGYYMKHGNGSFRYNTKKNELDIYDLYTNGKMSNFVVNSHTNLNTKKIDANVDISFLKDFTTAINYIPIVGYIIMGDDGEFHTSIDITGTTNDPQLETHTVKEASRGFTGIIKRILTLPFKPFMNDETEDKK